MSWKFTDESSVTFQLSVSGPGEFSQSPERNVAAHCSIVGGTMFQLFQNDQAKIVYTAQSLKSNQHTVSNMILIDFCVVNRYTYLLHYGILATNIKKSSNIDFNDWVAHYFCLIILTDYLGRCQLIHLYF